MALDDDSMAEQVATHAPPQIASYRSIGSIPSMASTMDLQAATQTLEDMDRDEPMAVLPEAAALQADVERLSNCLWGVSIHQESVQETLDELCLQRDVREILDEPEIVEAAADSGSQSPPIPAHPPTSAELQAPVKLPKKLLKLLHKAIRASRLHPRQVRKGQKTRTSVAIRKRTVGGGAAF